MRVHQYVYFAVKSNRIPATDIVVCREPGLTVDEQINRILDRLLPHADRIGDLTAELDHTEGPGSSALQVVRVFEHPTGDEEDQTDPVRGLQKQPGQHQLLGRALPP